MPIVVRELPHKPAADIFDSLRQDGGAVFLDSSLENTLGQYSVIGLNPYMTIEERDGTCYCNGEAQAEGFEQVLSRYLKAHREDNPTDLPLIGGAVGYLTYDYGRKFEKIASRHAEKMVMPEASFTFYDNFLIEDLAAAKLWVTAGGHLEPQEASIRAIEMQVQAAKPAASVPKHSGRANFTPNFMKAAYKQAIDRMIDYIVEGDIYIANMTQQLTIESDVTPYDAFRYLRTHNPSPFGGYLDYGDFQIVCASPERFLKVKDGRIETRPIKGTRPRGATPEEDAALRQELQASEKDRSELLMIVDLERNDLNRVCEPGSVEVTEHFAVEAYATVFHLVSTIVGQLRPDKDVVDVIQATFPGGSITGAPKIRAMEIIDALENDRRSLYTGSIGYLALDGSCDLNIVIRTAVHQDGMYYLGVGGGITCESDLEFEYEETLQKAKAVLEALCPPERRDGHDADYAG